MGEIGGIASAGERGALRFAVGSSKSREGRVEGVIGRATSTNGA